MSDYDRHVFELSPLTTFFYVLCKKKLGWYFDGDAGGASSGSSGPKSSTELGEESRRIPDTVVWENNIPKGWFTYDANEKQIVRRKMETKPVYDVMTHGWSDENDVVAVLFGKNSHKEDSEHFFEYLTMRQLGVLLFESKCAKGTVVLQKFMRPYNGQHIDTLQATWSPKVAKVTRRQNIHPYKDINLTPLERCSTFEGPPHLSREVCVSQRLKKDIKDMCAGFVKHFHDTDPKYNVTRLVMYFVLTEKSRVHFMYTPCVRVSPVNKMEKVRTALELRNQFDTSGAALRRLMSTEGAQNNADPLADHPPGTGSNNTGSSPQRKSVMYDSRISTASPGRSVSRTSTTNRVQLDSLNAIVEPSCADIWATTDRDIFPPFRGPSLTPQPTSPTNSHHPTIMSRATSAASFRPEGGMRSPTRRHNVANLLVQYRDATQNHRRLKSSHLRSLRALRPQVDAIGTDLDVRRMVRMQYLALKEANMSDAEKMEYIHLALQKHQEQQIMRQASPRKSPRSSTAGVTSSTTAGKAGVAPTRRRRKSLSSVSLKDLEEKLRDFEYEATSFFMTCEASVDEFMYTFPQGVARPALDSLCEKLKMIRVGDRVEWDDDDENRVDETSPSTPEFTASPQDVVLPFQRNIGQAIHRAVNDVLRELMP